MSPRPGRILEDRAIPFPRPRQLDLTFASEFTEIVQALRAQIVRTPTGAKR